MTLEGTHDAGALLRRHFGFETFKPGQEAVIGHLLAGRSAAAVFPTGGGKSLCYQLPALALPGLTLVVSPLIALMKDQIDALRRRGIAAQRLDSTMSADEYRAVMEDVRGGALRLLYVAPERFNNERFRESITRVPVSLFAVDEAHCISEWGHNFRPDYLKLAGFAKECAAGRVLALTATATEAVLDDVCRFFEIAPECAVRTGFYRPNLTLLATPMTAAERDGALLERLRERPRGATVVYVTLQRTAETLAERLAKAGLPARAYHAGMDDEVRAEVQDWFLAAPDGVVVATIAFGMGVDKPDIRYVYHYNLPKSLENLSQEIGRAGRDGQPSTCEVLACGEDLNVLENFVYGDTPAPSATRGLIDELFAQGADFDVSLYELSSRHDIRPLVVRTLLTYLELDGYLRGGTPFYSSYRFKPLLSSAQILERFDGERRTFLAAVLAQASKARTWFTIDAGQAASAVGAPRDRVVRALDYLGEQKLLDLRAAGVRLRYHRLKAPGDPAALAADLQGRMQGREARELARMREVLDLVALDGCQVRALGAHFGDPPAEPCGHCSWCLGGQRPAEPPARPDIAVDPDTWDGALALQRAHPEALHEPRALARFLCGVGSPALSRARLTRHALFGALAQVPFDEVHRRAAAAVPPSS